MTEDFDEGQRRRALQRVHLVAGISLGALIVLLANYLGFRNFERWDMTSEARYTLSDRTVQTVEALEREITITLLLSEGEEEFADVRELLSRYDAASPLLRVREVDPDRQADVARGLAQRYDLNLQSMGGSDPHGHDHGGGGDHTTLSDVAALLTRGERFWKVTRDDLIAIGTGEDGPRVDVQAERAITGALVALERNEKTRVCTTTGRGERTIDAGDRGLRYLRDELARENAEVETLDGFGEGFAEGCDAVFVLGPRSAFRSEEAQALVDYAKEGGRLLLALDPNVRRSGVLPSGFERPLAEVDIAVDDTIVVERNPDRLLGNDPSAGLLLAPQPHELTMPALSRGAPLVAGLSRTVRSLGEEVVVLLEGSAVSYGKRDLGPLFELGDLEPSGRDEEAPATLAVARAFEDEGEDEGRIVVVGNSDFMEDATLEQPAFSNGDVMLATVGWLTQRPELVSVPPRTSRIRAVVMSEGDVSAVWWRVLAFLPGAFVLLGFSVWWTRRA